MLYYSVIFLHRKDHLFRILTAIRGLPHRRKALRTRRLVPP